MDYKRDYALSRDLFCVSLLLFIQMLFRAEKYHHTYIPTSTIQQPGYENLKPPYFPLKIKTRKLQPTAVVELINCESRFSSISR
jgi:hypothetical protein